MDFDFNVIFEYFVDHFAEILLGLEMLLLRLVKKKTPEEIQAKKDKREKKRLEKDKRKLCKALQRIEKNPSVSALNGGCTSSLSCVEWEKCVGSLKDLTNDDLNHVSYNSAWHGVVYPEREQGEQENGGE